MAKKVNVQWARVYSPKEKTDGKTNRQFALENENFIEACKSNNVEPTKRQASKWRNRKGRAYMGRKSMEAAA
jgi:hypothetical protein